MLRLTPRLTAAFGASAVVVAVAVAGCSGAPTDSAPSVSSTAPAATKTNARQTGMQKPTVNPNLGASPLGSKG